MTEQAVKVYFMGSGAIAIPAAAALLASPLTELVGLASQPDRPAGRKKRLTPTPLALWAAEAGLVVDKPEKISADDFVDGVRSLQPDIIVVIAYGQLLRENMLTAAPYGCLNVHASILPAYRGASPIFSAVLNGDAESGVSMMQMEKGLDTGPVYRIHKLAIAADDTSGSLEQRLADLAAEKLVGDLIAVVRGGLRGIPQEDAGASKCSKINKSFGLLDWHCTAKAISKKVHACQPWPGSWTYFQSGSELKRLAITQAQPLTTESVDALPGTVVQVGDTLCISCAAGDSIEISRVKPEGKREMDVKDFLRGVKLQAGDRLMNPQSN